MKKHCLIPCLTLLACLSLPASEWHVDDSAHVTGAEGSASRPFQTIGAALKHAVHGDTITVHGGTYRESLVIRRRRGVRTLTLRAAPGQRPVLSGRRHITNWRKEEDGLYHATIDFLPRNLFIDGAYMPLARYPEDGWLRMTSREDGSSSVPLNERIPIGSSCYIWLNRGNIFGTFEVTGCDGPGVFTVHDEKRRLSRQAGKPDRCFFLGHSSFIRHHGQWGWRQTGKQAYELSLRLDADPRTVQIEVGGDGTPLTISQSSNIAVSGFDIMGGSPYGVHVNGSESIDLSGLGLFWNYHGFYSRGSRDIRLTDSRISCNQKAFSFIDMKSSSVRSCDVGYNYEDGLVVSWKSKDILLEGNRIHHHVWWGHPDNVQFFRDVRNVTLKDNLMFSSCQGIMAQELDGCQLENNVCLGTGAYMFIWGWGSSNHIVLNHNTLLFSCYGALSMSGKGYDVTHNVIMNLNFGRGPLAERQYRASTNLHMTAGKYWQVCCDGTWLRNLKAFCQISGETDSVFQSLPQPGLPQGVGCINESTIADCTKDTLLLRTHATFKVDDIIEVNFDQIPRRITAVCKGAITFTPRLIAKPLSGYVVLNWGHQKDMRWAPRFDSRFGSSLSLDDVRLDRRTTVPLPPQVKRFIDRIDLLIPPQGF